MRFRSLQVRSLSRDPLSARSETVRYQDKSVWRSEEENIYPWLINLSFKYNSTAVK